VSHGEWPAEDLEKAPSCPACGASARTLLYDGLSDRLHHTAPGEWRLVQCGDCASVYLDPRPTESSIGRAYSSYYTHTSYSAARPRGARAALLNAYLNARWGYDLKPSLPFGRVIGTLLPVRAAVANREIRHQPYQPGRRLLDVGAGSGAFVALARKLGWDAEGIDPDTTAVAAARHKGIPMSLGRLADLGGRKSEFDVITLSHVIEHLHEPLHDLQRIRRLLVPGGRLWIATPNLLALGHRLFGHDWVGLDPPRHLVLFTPSSLERLLRDSGFVSQGLHRPAPTAWANFDHSAALRANRPVYDDAQRQGHSIRAAAALADRLGYLVPRLAEELVITARRAD
jgi:SAM-dependent methyltransferase